jgi:hypothetical protein
LETAINTQLPQADDIDFRSLEYLFAPPAEPSPVEPPWVDVIVGESDVKSCELLRLDACVKFLEQSLNETRADLADANMRVGYLKGILEEREEELKVLPDLRLRAAKSIATDIDRDKLLAKVARLEAENAAIKSHTLFRFEQNVKRLLCAEVSTHALTILEALALAAVLVVALMYIRAL